MHKYLVIIFLAILAPALSFAQKVDSLVFGSGGGLTGQVTAYRITKSAIEKGKGLTSISYSTKEKFSKRKFKKLQSEASVIYTNTEAFSHPGNTYRFLEIHCSRSSKKFVWGASDFIVPNNVKEFYDKLITTVTK